MGRRSDGEATPALAALTRAGITFTRHAYQHDPRSASYGAEAAQALGVDPERVLKTLVVDTGNTLCLAIVAVSRSLDLKALARALGVKKVAMAGSSRAQRATGHVVGAISPIAQRSRLRTVIDARARDQATVLVSAGRRGLEIELSPDDLATVTGATFDPIGR
ncbi:Cys-tRNA(Pro) deacylase [Aeromicrobium sp. CTD01-1L150]|uniref:Cys-tRNA(Pro) deacylase n=1 Tax=Aeromicrobium sp. CTD01-1L150 TaxID=3341830 RepID=UPI0035BFB150